MRVAYFNCIGGASGDMIMAALLDSGLSLQALTAGLNKLDVQGFSLTAQPAKRGGVGGTHLTVTVAAGAPRFKHISDFVDTVTRSSLSASVKEMATRIFERLGVAEAAVHKASPDDVHLHELASMDTLVDVCGAVIGLELLGIEQVYASPLPSGSGVFQVAHGKIPCLSPATAALIADANAPLGPPPANTHDSGETVTPTGAAILTTLATFEQPVINMDKVGYGLGKRDHPKYPNALAVLIGEANDASQTTELVLLETNLDDTTAEVMAYVQEKLLSLGAKDAWFTPIQMKKGRPGTKLSALVAVSDEATMAKVILRETSTLGVRMTPVRRYEAGREQVVVDTPLGKIEVKLKKLEGRVVSASPEYESCKKIAQEKDIPLQEVMRVAQRAAEDVYLP